ncbi:conserved hypothetical protein [uncultured Paludibacter sp.]|uniref:Uncharacterized protein n=1 Tax=uncultured Paludibacter sp. TaxID=497635 RepID=A0A653AJ85_9BACT|nr:conserved hypothetical protein [uncultured Paludibacter sp.]
MQTETPIDVVISWVDGKQPAHKRKIIPYLGHFLSIHEEINAPTRFNSEGEIFFCVASILKYAPFVRKIFIVTDDQNPNLTDFINQNFPENKIPIEIVDHTIIFSGYEDLLPTFNSLSIETCLYRIPDLSENFVYFNDDFFLMRPIQPSDWFKDNKAVAYGTWRNVFFDNLLRKFRLKKKGRKPFGFKDSMLNAAKALGIKSSYFSIRHTPLPLKRSIFEKYFFQHSGIFVMNISHKFRNKNQFNPQALFYLSAFKSGDCVQESKNKLLFIKPARKGKKYIDRKRRKFEKNEHILFGCIESADMTKKDVRNKLFDWLKSLLNIEIPKKTCKKSIERNR